MDKVRANNMTSIFYDTLFYLDKYGTRRTPNEPIELTNYSFELLDINNNLICTEGIDFGYLCAEEMWFALENEELKFINSFKAPGFQRNSEDGIYSNSAYGHIVHQRYGFDQLDQVIEILKAKPYSRRAVINFNVPNRHRRTCFDEICTFNLSFYINNNGLNCTCCMRSNDIIGCMPYDVAYFTNLQKYIANRLNVDYGTYYHFAISAHHYYPLTYNELLKRHELLGYQVHFDYEKMLIELDNLYNYYETKILSQNENDKSKNNESLQKCCESLGILTNNRNKTENEQ